MLALSFVLVGLFVCEDAQARPRYRSRASLVQRRGGQAEGMVGVSACVPGKIRCHYDGLARTGPLIGGSVNLGVRLNPYMFLGGGYSLGFFDPRSRRAVPTSSTDYRWAHQNTFVVVLRGIVPLRRFDFGFELSPGWSRQTFRARSPGQPDEYSQGFALRPGVSVAVFLTNQLFLGAKADAIFNFHGEICQRTESTRDCDRKMPDNAHNRASVHQILAGLYLGGTF